MLLMGLQIAQGLQICCTGPAHLLHRACKYAARRLQICCTEPASLLHRACTYAAQGLQACCTGPASMLHTFCRGAAQGLQICCTGSANMLQSVRIWLHKSNKSDLRTCRAARGLPGLLHRACKYAARGLQAWCKACSCRAQYRTIIMQHWACNCFQICNRCYIECFRLSGKGSRCSTDWVLQRTHDIGNQ